jgi:hypothetical protein
MEIWGGIGRGMRGFFSGMVRGVSDPCEGSKILFVLFEPRLVCGSLPDLRSSRNVEGVLQKEAYL